MQDHSSHQCEIHSQQVLMICLELQHPQLISQIHSTILQCCLHWSELMVWLKSSCNTGRHLFQSISLGKEMQGMSFPFYNIPLFTNFRGIKICTSPALDVQF